MDTLPLPPRPNLGQYKKRAKSLVAAAQSDEPNAVRRWATDWLESLVALLGVLPSEFVRNSMDRAVTRIVEHVIAKRRSGDLETLATLVRANPTLIRAHSSRVHHVTLLHYVAANGVEDFRQKTPKNAVEITRFLLDAGAEPDALADTYGGDTLQTTMNLLVSSAHPADAGLQSAIAEALLDYGAAVNGVADDESPLMTALRFGYIDPAETLARRGARVQNPRDVVV